MDAHPAPPPQPPAPPAMPTLPADRLEALAAFLRDRGLVAPDASAGGLRVSRLTAGYANLTWRIDTAATDPLVVRQAPPGVQVKGAYDLAREYRAMRGLAELTPVVPRPLALCEDEAVLGSPFVVMPFVRGRTFGAGTDVSREAWPRVAAAFVGALAALHRLDPAASGLPPRAAEPGYARRQLAGAIQRFGAAQTRSVPLLDEVFAALLRDPPSTGALAVTHNDYRLDNVIFDPARDDRVRAVIDWEMAAIGDPWLDVGSALAYWTEAGDGPELVSHSLGPTHLPGAPSRAAWAERYGAAVGSLTPRLPWYVTLGIVRLVVVLQQLQARARHGPCGPTPDARLARIEPWIDALVRRAAGTLERDRP